MATTTHGKFGGLSMAGAIASQNAAIDAALRDNFNRTVAMFDRIRAAFAERRAARIAYRELSELNDRELADLGIVRSEIRDVVLGRFQVR